MNPFAPDRSRRALPTLLLVLVIVILAGAAVFAFMNRARLESDPPQITLSSNAEYLGIAPLDIRVADTGAGLRSLTVTLSQGGTVQTLASEQYAQPVAEKKISVALAKVPGIKEGPAVLRVVTRDNSFWHWGAGN